MTTLNRNDQLGRTNSPWSAALKVLCSILAITGSAWPNQAGSLRADFDSVQGKSVLAGEAVYVDEESVIIVEDPVLAYLGGKSGYVRIGTDLYCLDENKCPPGLTYGDPSGCDGNFCTDNTSFRTQAVFYNAIGSKTVNTSGGFQVKHKFCWKAFIPWSCKTTTGSNQLSITANFWAPQSWGAVELGSLQKTKTNVRSMSVRHWSLFVTVKSKPGVGGGGSLPIGRVCGYHNSSSGFQHVFLISNWGEGECF